MSTLGKVFRHRRRAAQLILAATGMCRLFSAALGAPVEPFSKDTLAPNNPALGAQLPVWLRADALGLKDSAQVFRWPDSSGHNRDAAPTLGVYEGTGLPPTFARSSSINGHPAVHFDLSSKYGIPIPDSSIDPNPERVSENARQHWAFRKPVRPAVPVVKDRKQVNTPIDAFILKKLEEQHIGISPMADPTTLMRRLYFDLIGLPPSPQEVLSFVQDESQNAWERLIDQLLASPHFGERWG